MAHIMLSIMGMEGKKMEKTRKELVIEAYQRFLRADEIWSAQLQAKFGKDAGDKRYTKEGATLPGHDEFVKAGDEWRRLM